jgi:predicted DNA-binding protein
MRKIGLVLLGILLPVAASAQRVLCPPVNGASREYEERLDGLAKAISRDSFIVVEIVHAAGDLEDFQVNIAVQKALDRVNEAYKRASQNPQASPFFLQTLNGLQITLRHARDQGSMADLVALRKELMLRGGLLQTELFRELDAGRRERQQLVLNYTKLQQLDQQLESSLIESLGTMFEFVRAGGKR